MLESIVIGVVIYVIYRLFANIIKGRGPKPGAVKNRAKAWAEEVKDVTTNHVAEMSRDRKLAVWLELQQDEEFQNYIAQLKVTVPAEQTEQTI